MRHGIYMIPVTINGKITLPFIVDTGASEVAIPEDVFLTVLRSGTVKDGDFLGLGKYRMADGSEASSQRFVLHQMQVGNHIIPDVIASVISAKGDPLLGASFLSRLPSWTIDNNRHALVLREPPRPPPSAEHDIAIKSLTMFVGTCRYQIVVGFFPRDEKVGWAELKNGRSLLTFMRGNTMFFLSGEKDRQPNLENYYLSIDTFHMKLDNGKDVEDRHMEGECHFRLNKKADKFFNIDCDIYDRAKDVGYSFYLDHIQKFDRKVF